MSKASRGLAPHLAKPISLMAASIFSCTMSTLSREKPIPWSPPSPKDAPRWSGAAPSGRHGTEAKSGTASTIIHVLSTASSRCRNEPTASMLCDERSVLWSPSATMMNFGPPYSSWSDCVWCVPMKSSRLAQMKRAGSVHLWTHLIAQRSLMSKPATDLTLVANMDSAMRVTIDGTTTPRSRPLATSSSASWQKSANGESSTMALTVMPPTRASASCTW
mmetsp:Transcript_17549/g.54833  ORF Transcript_17549/g.54833 Transcript_17549/m.54833 type:complete len:219 (+) Transcript_17549:1832-2488(+)